MTRPSRRPFDGDRLFEARSASYQTQEMVARALGVTVRTVQRWELGESQPQLPQIAAVAALFGRDPEWFLVADDDGDEPTRVAA